MAITKARLISKINEAFRRQYDTATTELDDLITDTVVELSTLGNFLHDEATLVTIAGEYIYQLPEDYKAELIVKIDDNNPLKFWDFRRFILYLHNDNITGVPYAYSLAKGYVDGEQTNQDFLYLYPIPDDNNEENYTLRLFYVAYHPRVIKVNGVDTNACDYILFSDKYESLLKYFLLYKWAIDKNLDVEAQKYLALFNSELVQFRAQEQKVFRHTTYRRLI